MKNILSILALITVITTNAQSWQGEFSSKYGNLTFVTETGNEYPNKNIIYGDYGQNGTMVGFLLGNEFIGEFHNGNDSGQFRLQIFPGSSNRIFSGFWGYGNNVNYNTPNRDFWWDGKEKSSSNAMPKNIKSAVWSGKWSTTYGDLILKQIGDKVMGSYKNVGEINATYNKNTKTLKGTFTNNGAVGYLEFQFIGNSFGGKWGWNSAMTEGSWNGNKVFKSNQ